MTNIRAGIVALVAKIGPKLLFIGVKLAKVLKVGKFGLAIGSMVAYAYLFTWQFSVLIMISLFFHESGHIWAMKRCGLKTKGIYFIPFLGAAAVSEDMFKTRRDEVYIAIMGPIWGFSLAVGTALIYVFTGNALFAAAAGWMAMVNLFNLLPVNPLDGGRIMKSIAFSINSKAGLVFLVVGILISIGLIVWAKLILFLILLLIGGLELFFEYREYEVRPSMTHRGIVISTIAYMAIVAILWALMAYTSHVPEVDIARKLFMS
jgi:Zn-dependent protease